METNTKQELFDATPVLHGQDGLLERLKLVSVFNNLS